MKFYTLVLRDGDGQPITDYAGLPGLKVAREQIKDCEQDFAHYEGRHYLVTEEESGEVVIDVVKGRRSRLVSARAAT